MRRAADGWRAVLRIGAVEHRVWLKKSPTIGAHYLAELPFDGDFDARAYAARRLWRAMNGRTPGPAFHQLSKQRRERLSAAIRALDARAAAVAPIVRSPKLCSARKHPGSCVENARSAQSNHPSRAKRPRIDARRLSRTSATQAQGQIAPAPGVSKIYPTIIGIPLRGPAPP